MTEKFLDSKTPEEVTALFADAAREFRLSTCLHTFDGKPRAQIVAEFELIRLYIISKLTICRE